MENKIDIEVRYVLDNQLFIKQFVYTADEKHLKQRNEKGVSLLSVALASDLTESLTQVAAEEEMYGKFGVPYIIPEMREGDRKSVV